MKSISYEIKRYSFFKDTSGGNLRYTEFSPNKVCKDHKICNCTKQVAIRPEGIPLSINTEAVIHYNIDDNRKADWTIRSSALENNSWNSIFKFKGYWGDWEEKPFGFTRNEITGEYIQDIEKYAYFSREKDGFKIGIPKKGYGLTNHFFGNLFFGNIVDISKLMNGHSPSEVIKLQELTAEDIWVHDCNYGHESMIILKDNIEKTNWKKFLTETDRLNRLFIEPALLSTYTVDDCYHLLESNKELTHLLKWPFEFLLNTIINLDKTEFYKCCTEAYKISYEPDGFIIDSITGKTSHINDRKTHE
jgi:hypothetical protein